MDSFFSFTSSSRRSIQELLPRANTRALRALAIGIAGLLGALFAFLGYQIQGYPNPTLPLEHANLLQAETLASFRLTNPAHPVGSFLETYYTLQSPSYAAAVPPAPGLLLAAGLMLGDPIYGLWLGAFLLNASLAWLLLSFNSARWALIGGGFAALWFCFLSYWSQSFASPLASGVGVAITAGSLIRVCRRKAPARIYAALFGAGLGWLWFSNPTVLVFTGLPLVVVFIRGLLRQNNSRLLLYAAAPLVLTFALQLPLNHAVTGSWLTRPGTDYAMSYDRMPRFLWDRMELPPKFNHWRMEQYDVMVREAALHPPLPVGRVWGERIEHLILFYVGLPGTFLIGAHLMLGATRWTRVFAWSAAVTLLVPVLMYSASLGDSAGIAVLGTGLFVWALRRICLERARRSLACTWLLLIVFFSVLVSVFPRQLGFEMPKDAALHRVHKDKLLLHLQADPTLQLVVVEYLPTVDPHVEYVYNGANPDAQHIVWARWHPTADMSPLFKHFKDRKLWHLMVKPGTGEPELRPFAWNVPSTVAK